MPQDQPESPAGPYPRSDAAAAPQAEVSTGMTVEEEVLRVVSAQMVYQLHCECGRSWFELEVPSFVRCPACRKMAVVTMV